MVVLLQSANHFFPEQFLRMSNAFLPFYYGRSFLVYERYACYMFLLFFPAKGIILTLIFDQ